MSEIPESVEYQASVTEILVKVGEKLIEDYSNRVVHCDYLIRNTLIKAYSMGIADMIESCKPENIRQTVNQVSESK